MPLAVGQEAGASVVIAKLKCRQGDNFFGQASWARKQCCVSLKSENFVAYLGGLDKILSLNWNKY